MKRKLLILVALVAVVCLSIPAMASQIFTTPPGSTDSAGELVNAQAVFDIPSAGQLTVTLTNLLVNQNSIGQNISDIFFKVDTLSIGSVSSSSGTLRTVADDGSYTDVNDQPAGWALTYNGATGFHLNGLAGATYVPARTIIGSPDPGSNSYLAANGSIAGNGPHNPFMAGPVIFNLGIPGLTTSSTISDVVFSFGTTPGDNVAVPLPGAVVLLGAGLCRLAAYARRRKD